MKMLTSMTAAGVLAAATAMFGCSSYADSDAAVTGAPTYEAAPAPAAPLQPRAETPPPSPGEGYQWNSGYWQWNGTDYEWISGRWQPPSPSPTTPRESYGPYRDY